MNNPTRRAGTLFPVAGIVLFLLFLGSCMTTPISGRRQLALVPIGDLAIQSAQAYDELLEESDVERFTADARMVERVGERVAIAAEEFLRDEGLGDDLAIYDWQFTLINDDETVNAFCMTGGKIAIYSGILPIAQDEEGLAIIMGHEVAHAVARHGQERMSQALITRLGAATIAAATEEQPEQTRNILLGVYGAGAQLGILLPYSRQHEEEADTIGLILSARAGYDPRAAIPFWQRMQEIGGPRPPEFLSTHPAPQTRIQRLQAQMPEALEYYENR